MKNEDICMFEIEEQVNVGHAPSLVTMTGGGEWACQMVQNGRRMVAKI